MEIRLTLAGAGGLRAGRVAGLVARTTATSVVSEVENFSKGMQALASRQAGIPDNTPEEAEWPERLAIDLGRHHHPPSYVVGRGGGRRRAQRGRRRRPTSQVVARERGSRP